MLITGLTEEALFTLQNYTELPEKGILINIYGCCLFLFGGKLQLKSFSTIPNIYFKTIF
jgi:hypothetical protein